MKNIENFLKSPPAEEFLRELRYELLKVQRPPNEVILDEVDFCQFLKYLNATLQTCVQQVPSPIQRLVERSIINYRMYLSL